VLGAVYVDRGHAVAAQVIRRVFAPMLADAARQGAGLDWKTSLQELAAAQALGVPQYVLTETGPHHDKTFTAAARIAGETLGTGTGRSKKEAEKRAAESAWTVLLARRLPDRPADVPERSSPPSG